jgi:hypothetical protein
MISYILTLSFHKSSLDVVKVKGKEFIDDIIDTFNNKTHFIGFCDLAKAPDCLNYSVLLS